MRHAVSRIPGWRLGIIIEFGCICDISISFAMTFYTLKLRLAANRVFIVVICLYYLVDIEVRPLPFFNHFLSLVIIRILCLRNVTFPMRQSDSPAEPPQVWR